MADDTEDTVDPSTSLMTLLGGGSPYTTHEAHDTAKGIITRFENQRDLLTDTEDEYYARLDKAAQEARNTLQAARDYVTNRKYSNAQTMFAAARALGKPTKSGSFGETMSNLGGELEADAGNRAKFADERAVGENKIDQELVNVDQTLATGRVAAIQKRRTDEQRLAIEALKILAKETRPGASGGAGLSDAEKYVRGTTQLVPGMPGYNQAVAARQVWIDDQRKRETGTDSSPESEVVTAERANELGIPVLTRNPLAGYSTKQYERRRAQLETQAQEALTAVNTARDKSMTVIQDLNRFKELNDDTQTGPLIGYVTQYLTSGGQQMAGISSNQARNMRVPGEGPMSNYDATELKNATVSTRKGKVANRDIADAMIAAKERSIEYAKFVNDFVVAYGHTVGADQAWQEYVTDNPIFDPEHKGTLQKNPNKVPYQEYFARKNQGAVLPAGPRYNPNTGITGGQTTLNRARGGRVRMADGGMTRSGPAPTRLDEIARALAQGASFNFSDELLAGGDPEELRRERAILGGFHEDDPVAAIGTEIAGSLPGAIGSVYAAKKGLDLLARNPKSRVGKAAAVASKFIPKSNTGKAIVGGAGAGALSGYGASQNPGSEALDTTLGAVSGAVMGPLAGLMAKYGVKTVQGLWNLVTNNRVDAADRMILEALIKDKTDVAGDTAALVASNRRGVPTSIGDLEGRNIQGLRTFAAQKGGAGGEEMVDRAAERTAGAAERVTSRVNRDLKPDAYYGALEDLKTHLYNDAKPIYEQAYAENPAVNSQFFRELIALPGGREAYEEAREAMLLRAAGSDTTPNFGTVDALGELKRPSLELLDRMKRVIDGRINKAKRAGDTSVQSTWDGVRGRLVRELEDPKIVKGSKYVDARKQYAGDLEVLNALDLGRDNFMRMGVDEFKELTKNMSYAEKEALRTGTAHAIFDAIDSARDTINPAGKVVGSRGMREKLAQLFDSPKKAEQFLADIEQEYKMFTRDRKLVATGERAAANKEADRHGSLKDLGASVGVALAGGHGPAIANSPGWATRFGNVLSRTMRGTSEDVVSDVARRLSDSDPQALRAASDSLTKELARVSRQLQDQSSASLSGALSGASRFGGQPPYGDLSTEEEDGYQSGGRVGVRRFGTGGPANLMPGGPYQMPMPQSIPAPITYPVGWNGGSSSYVTNPTPAGGGQTFGTGAQRSRAALLPIDWERYGETGGEARFFDDNRSPDAIYTTAPATVAGNSYGSAAGDVAKAGGSALGLGTVLGGLSKIKPAIGAAKDIAGLLGLGSAAGTGTTGAVLGSLGTWGGTAGAGTIGSLTGGGMAAMNAASPLGMATLNLGAGAGAAGAGAGATGAATTAAGAGSGMTGTLAALASNPATWAVAAAVAAGLVAEKNAPKSSPLNKFNVNTGSWDKGENFSKQKYDANSLNSYYGPAIQKFTETGDVRAAIAALGQPTNAQEQAMFAGAKHLFSGTGNPFRQIAKSKGFKDGEWKAGNKGKKALMKELKAAGLG